MSVLMTWLIFTYVAVCELWDCKNRAHSVSWPEVVKGLTNQGVDCSVG